MKEPEFQIYQCVNPECRFRCPNDLTHRALERCPVCGADFLPSGQPFTNYQGNTGGPSGQDQHIEVILDNLRSTLNVGSIFRTADGAGVRHIHCCGTTPTPRHPKIEKSGLGAEGFTAWTYHRNTLDLVKTLKQEGFTIICLEATANSVPVASLSKLRTEQKFALVLGNEVSGIDSAVLEVADQVIAIPMLGRKTSLNVAVAFGIAIYTLLN
jgi:23S rRNA (guanosine2251-2'-O)-methyltransferase